MEEHFTAIREWLNQLLKERDTVPRPVQSDYPNVDAFDLALTDWLNSKAARREAALGEHLRGAFRSLEDLENFYNDPPTPHQIAEPEVPVEARPVVQPEGTRAASHISPPLAASSVDDASEWQPELDPPPLLHRESV